MDSEIIKRYNKEPNGPYLIDVMVEKPEDIFTEYDGVIAWNRKDLDEDIDHYLMSCIEELEGMEWAIRMSLSVEQDDALERKIIYAIRSFYKYKQREVLKHFMGQLRKTAFSILLGLALLTAITFWGASFEGHLGEIAREGLMVAVWVTMWQGFASLIYEIAPTISRKRRCREVAEARISFRYPNA